MQRVNKSVLSSLKPGFHSQRRHKRKRHKSPFNAYKHECKDKDQSISILVLACACVSHVFMHSCSFLCLRLCLRRE